MPISVASHPGNKFLTPRSTHQTNPLWCLRTLLHTCQDFTLSTDTHACAVYMAWLLSSTLKQTLLATLLSEHCYSRSETRRSWPSLQNLEWPTSGIYFFTSIVSQRFLVFSSLIPISKIQPKCLLTLHFTLSLYFIRKTELHPVWEFLDGVRGWGPIKSSKRATRITKTTLEGYM